MIIYIAGPMTGQPKTLEEVTTMRMQNPCPFCECLSLQILTPTSSPNRSTGGLGFQVECINCGARGPLGYKDKSSAKLSWEYGDTPGDVSGRMLSHPCPHESIGKLIQERLDLEKEYSATAMLRQILLDGKMLSGEVVEAMRINGHTTKQTRAAREEIGLLVTRKGFGRDTRTYWELPAHEMRRLRPHHWLVARTP